MGMSRASSVSLVRLVWRALRGFFRRSPNPMAGPEGLLLLEAEVTAPIAPGMAGKVTVHGRGAALEVDARAADGDQAFARGMRVRLIDFRDGSYIVEAADEEHLVR